MEKRWKVVPFHIRANIAKHMELQNVVGALMDQP